MLPSAMLPSETDILICFNETDVFHFLASIPVAFFSNVRKKAKDKN